MEEKPTVTEREARQRERAAWEGAAALVDSALTAELLPSGIRRCLVRGLEENFPQVKRQQLRLVRFPEPESAGLPAWVFMTSVGLFLVRTPEEGEARRLAMEAMEEPWEHDGKRVINYTPELHRIAADLMERGTEDAPEEHP